MRKEVRLTVFSDFGGALNEESLIWRHLIEDNFSDGSLSTPAIDNQVTAAHLRSIKPLLSHQYDGRSLPVFSFQSIRVVLLIIIPDVTHLYKLIDW